MTRVESTLLSIALAGVVTLAAYTDVLLVGAVIVITQIMVAAAPTPADASGRPVAAPRFGAAAIAGLIATGVTLYPQVLLGADGTQAGSVGSVESGVFAGLVPAVAAGVIVALVSQMLRKDGRKSLVLTTGYAVTLCVFAALAIGWIGAAQSVGGAPVVAVAAIALAAALLVWLLPFDRVVIGSFAVAAGGVGGALAAPYLDDGSGLTWALGALAGVGVALFSILGQVMGQSWSSGRRHASGGWGFPGALSLALSAPIVFVASQFVGVSFTLS
ncbi:MAG: hypothetical protein ACXWX1_02855 [Aeromicrobium sp.]